MKNLIDYRAKAPFPPNLPICVQFSASGPIKMSLFGFCLTFPLNPTKASHLSFFNFQISPQTHTHGLQTGKQHPKLEK